MRPAPPPGGAGLTRVGRGCYGEAVHEFPSVLDALGDRVSTPAPIVLVDVVDENIRRMQDFADLHGKQLRPHVKTHKSIDIGRRQIAAGAVGITAGTIGEAEVFAAAGFDDIFLAYPIWPTGGKASRLAALAARTRLRVGVENVAAVDALVPALGDRRGSVGLVIEVDCGAHRSGIAPHQAGRLARCARARGLRVDGVFTYPGHGGRAGSREGAARDQAVALRAAVAALADEGIRAEVVSAGSSPTVAFSTDDVITELRPGEYVFNDVDNHSLGACELDQIGLFVATTVVSDQGHDHVVVDAGTKALAREGDPVRGWGQVPALGGVLSRLNEYHGFLRLPAGGARPPVGSVVPLVPHHVCPVVNSFDELILTDRRGSDLGTWTVHARGRLN